MSLPASYTAASLALYLHGMLGPLAGALGWEPATGTPAGPGSYAEVVNETMLALDVDDLAALTSRQDVQRLRAVGRRELWRAVAAATAGHYRFSADNQAVDRQQVYEHAQSEYLRASADCQRLGAGAVVATTTPVVYSGEGGA